MRMMAFSRIVLMNGRLVDGDAVGELHEHLDRAGLAGVHAARGPVHRLGLLEQALGLGLGEAARVGQLGVDGLVLVEVLDRLLVGDGDDDPVAALLGLADVEDLDPGRRRGQGPHVLVDVGRVAQDVLGPGDVAEDLERRRDALGVGQIVDVLRGEVRVGRELADLLGVFFVDLLLGQGRRKGQAEDPDGGSARVRKRLVSPGDWVMTLLLRKSARWLGTYSFRRTRSRIGSPCPRSPSPGGRELPRRSPPVRGTRARGTPALVSAAGDLEAIPELPERRIERSYDGSDKKS